MWTVKLWLNDLALHIHNVPYIHLITSRGKSIAIELVLSVESRRKLLINYWEVRSETIHWVVRFNIFWHLLSRGSKLFFTPCVLTLCNLHTTIIVYSKHFHSILFFGKCISNILQYRSIYYDRIIYNVYF